MADLARHNGGSQGAEESGRNRIGDEVPNRSLPVAQATAAATPADLPDPCPSVPPGSSNQPKRCAANNRAGAGCRAFPLRESTLCAFHDPSYRPELLRAAAKGGRSRRTSAIPLPDQPLDLGTRAGIQAAIQHLVALQFAGQVSDRQLARLTRLIVTAASTIDGEAEEESLMAAIFGQLPR